MDLETAQTSTTAKLPLLKQGEYDMWKLKIEQYFQVQDYTLWDVIENGNSFKPAAQTTINADGSSTTLIPGPVTANEKTQKRNDVKAKSMLLMALQNEHLPTFNQYKDAKTLFAAIQTIFGCNDATKKTQKTLMSKCIRTLVLQAQSLLILFLTGFRRLNKPDLDTMSFDDLYNNFKIVEQEVKGTASSSSSSSSQNVAFVSSSSSTNEVNTAYGVSTANTQVSPASTQVSTASTQVSTANLSDVTVYALLANQPNGSQLVHEDLEQIHEDNLEEMYLKCFMADEEVPKDMALMAFLDSELEKLKQEKESNKLKIEKFDNASKSLDKLIESQIPSKSRKGLGFVSYNAVPPPPTGLFSPPNLDLSNSGLEEFQQPKFEGYGPKTRKSVSKDTSNEVRESPDASLVEELVSNDKLEKKISFPTVAKINFVRPQQQEKPVRKPVKYAKMYRSQTPRGNQRNWNNQKSQQLGSDFVMYNKACFVCGSFDHMQANCNYH
ncbi:hypothetical protein Tco_1341360 [Tanacetum coccineum]